jgi:ketosteroid isomerase-like protein
MSIADNKQVVLDFFAAGERGDIEACLALLADDVSWTNIGTTDFSGTYAGKEAVVDDLIGPLFAQLRDGISSTIENLVAQGDVVVVQSSGKARTLDGVPYDNSYCQVMRIREGRICSVKEYFDTELATRVLRRE